MSFGALWTGYGTWAWVSMIGVTDEMAIHMFGSVQDNLTGALPGYAIFAAGLIQTKRKWNIPPRKENPRRPGSSF